MKKITALLLSIGMVFTLAACSGSKVNDKALDSLESSIQKLAELKSANYNIAMDVTDGEENVKAALHGDMKLDEKLPQASMILDMEASGQKIDNYMSLYLKDDVVYLDMMGLSQTKSSVKDMMGSTPMPSFSFDSDTFKLNKDDMKPYLSEASVKGNDLKLSFDTKKINEEAKKEAATMKQEITFNKLDMDITLKDGFMQKAVITMDMKSGTGDKVESVKGTITMEFNNINAVKSITFPDFSKFIEEKA